MLHLSHVQEHVLQELYQAEHLPGQSCSGSTGIPGTLLCFQSVQGVHQGLQDLPDHQ